MGAGGGVREIEREVGREDGGLAGKGGIWSCV